MTARIVDAALTRELRRSVLRPRLSAGDPLPGDELPAAIHLATVGADGVPSCCCFVYPDDPPRTGADPNPWRTDGAAWRLRQMATAPGSRGRGYGRAVIEAAVAHARGQGAAVLWCDARESAAGFYERCGWLRHGSPFTDAHHPTPHVRMWIPCGPDRGATR